MIFIVGKDNNTGNPVAIAVNGPRAVSADESCTTPAILQVLCKGAYG